MSKKRKNNFQKKTEKRHYINDKIRAYNVRLVGDNVEVGIYKIEEALEIAQKLNLDLVEINSTSKPVICKILNYEKYLYNLKKKKKDIQQNSKKNQLKEIRFGPNTADGDLEHKMKKAKEFLSKGQKVKITIHFKGRNIVHKERGELILLKFVDNLSEYSNPEYMPKLEGRKLNILLKPIKND